MFISLYRLVRHYLWSTYYLWRRSRLIDQCSIRKSKLHRRIMLQKYLNMILHFRLLMDLLPIMRLNSSYRPRINNNRCKDVPAALSSNRRTPQRRLLFYSKNVTDRRIISTIERKSEHLSTSTTGIFIKKFTIAMRLYIGTYIVIIRWYFSA